VGALRAVLAAKAEHEAALAELLGRHPDGGLFLALPGAGVVTAAGLLGELGEERGDLPSARVLQQVAGTAPVTKRSGQARFVVRRRACNKRLYEAMLQFAHTSHMQACRGDRRVSWVAELYQERRRKGDSVQQAYRVIAHRWAAILWAVWTRREPYDHLRYEAARRLRALPKAG
jgi:hypothetical protein